MKCLTHNQKHSGEPEIPNIINMHDTLWPDLKRMNKKAHEFMVDRSNNFLMELQWDTSSEFSKKVRSYKN